MRSLFQELREKLSFKKLHRLDFAKFLPTIKLTGPTKKMKHRDTKAQSAPRGVHSLAGESPVGKPKNQLDSISSLGLWR
jgi:hypothetical protein